MTREYLQRLVFTSAQSQIIMMSDEFHETNVDVVVVDDDPMIRALLVAMLSDVYRAFEQEPVADTIGLLRQMNPPVVVLDINMPGEDGITLLAKIRESLPQTITIMLTQSEDRASAIECLRLGAFDYLRKPCQKDELLAAVTRAVQEFNLRADLEHAHKMATLGELSAGIVHEIVNPLSIIQTRSRHLLIQLKKEGIESPMLFKITEVIQSETQRMISIIDGLRGFSRQSDGDPFLRESVAELIEKTLSFYGAKIKIYGIRLVSDVPENLSFECRGSQIQQVILNLLNNSCDAIRDMNEKWIRLEGRKSEGKEEIELTVTDSGGGIPEEVRKKIFEPFFTTKRAGEGTGLGMSIIKGIIEAHQGTLVVDASSPNTKFVIRLPMKQRSQKSASETDRKHQEIA
ncbi:MAG: response regulator [Deltaproteobacteria bacterium]|nr:response regulator [Deltaproteobacteria bacterium]